MQMVPVATTVVVRAELFTTEEEQALVGFLTGYSGLTREAYQRDLRQWVQWCTERKVALFSSTRVRPTSKALAVTLKPAVVPAPQSRAGSAPSPASIGTPRKKP